MKKIFLLILIYGSLFAYNDEDIKYFIDYEEYGQIKTKTIVKQHRDYIKQNLETLEKNQQVIWSYGGKDYKIVEVYNNIKDLKELDKQKTETQQKKELEEQKQKDKENQKETFKNIITLIIVLLIAFYIFKKMKNRKSETEEIFIEKEEKKQIEKVKKSVKIEEKKEIKIEKIKEEKNENLLDFNDLEKIRVEIYKKLKYNKEIEKEEKQKIYEDISILKIKILKKENLENLNNEINEINLKVK